MMDEYFMRGWTDNHRPFSADVARGIKAALAGLDRLAEILRPSHQEGADTYFTRAARACSEICAAMSNPKSRPH